MNVLSLFDGMSCGRYCLEQAGIKIENYYASEIDKEAIRVSNYNWGLDVKQLGDVRSVDTSILPKIDLLIGGSPCQGFSFAGLQLNFNCPKSKLFFEFVRILKETKPRFFLLENVRMKQEYQKIITDILGVNPIGINSCFVSGQKRQRLYWTNIPNVKEYFQLIEPDKTVLADYIETGIDDLELYLKPHELERAAFKYSNRYWKSGNRIGKMQFPDNINKKKQVFMCNSRKRVKRNHSYP